MSACEIPGRKAAQIDAFAAALGVPCAPVTEWCAGKGHLGRRIASHSGVAVTSLEIDARLCDAGRALAQRAGVATQGFVTVDVLVPSCAVVREAATQWACMPAAICIGIAACRSGRGCSSAASGAVLFPQDRRSVSGESQRRREHRADP